MTVNGQPADRRAIHEELERARTDPHHVVASATTSDLRRRTDGTRWTNQQMLWHMVFGHLVVSAGTVSAGYLLPGDRMRMLRRLVAPLMRRWVLYGAHYPVSDAPVEARAERDCDTLALLPQVRRPSCCATAVWCGCAGRGMPRCARAVGCRGRCWRSWCSRGIGRDTTELALAQRSGIGCVSAAGPDLGRDRGHG